MIMIRINKLFIHRTGWYRTGQISDRQVVLDRQLLVVSSHVCIYMFKDVLDR